jgi:hypothetical protein
MKKRNQTRRAAWMQLSPEVLAVLEECLDLNPSDPTHYRRRLQGFINSTLRYRKGMTAQQFVQLYVKQGKVCGICHKRPAPGPHSFMIDHDHNPPHFVRGLLCIRCNSDLKRYEEVGRGWRDYLANPPAKEVGLNIAVTRDPWRKLRPPTPETLGRLQYNLDHGKTLKELRTTENDLQPATVRSHITNRLLRLPDDTIERIRTQLATGTPQSQIAETVGVYKSTLKWLVSEGLRINR